MRKISTFFLLILGFSVMEAEATRGRSNSFEDDWEEVGSSQDVRQEMQDMEEAKGSLMKNIYGDLRRLSLEVQNYRHSCLTTFEPHKQGKDGYNFRENLRVHREVANDLAGLIKEQMKKVKSKRLKAEIQKELQENADILKRFLPNEEPHPVARSKGPAGAHVFTP